MNLSDEKNYQMLVEVLDSLELSGKNRELAEKYLHPDEEEDATLLAQAEHQDFSELPVAVQNKSKDYVEHLVKRKRTEVLGRYIHFTTAVGGATAVRVLLRYVYNLGSIKEYLSPALKTAMVAEDVAWNSNRLNSYGMKDLLETA